MAKSGQARVLNAEQFAEVVTAIKQHRHPEKNMAILMISFRLGLRVQEISLLEIKEVARLGPPLQTGRDFFLHEIMALPASYTKGADAMGRSKAVHERKTLSFTKQGFDQVVKNIENLVLAGGKPNPEDFYPPMKHHKGRSRDLPMKAEDLREALTAYLRIRLDADPGAKASDRLFLSQKGGPYSPSTLQRHMGTILKDWGRIEKAASHSGRRTLLTNIIRTTKSVKAAQKVAGHVSPATTLIYEEPCEDSIAAAMDEANSKIPLPE